jgi:AbrB family looped-hinge helix DNA binding protein
MRITSKGQVTIPQEIRELRGLFPSIEVEFKITKQGVLIKKAKTTNKCVAAHTRK